MSDVFLNLPVPGAVGVGASIDTSTMAGEKTIIVGGSFVASLTVEASADGTNWAPVATFSGAAPRKNVVVAACFMRVRVTVLTSGTPTVDVAAERAEAQSVTLAIPAGNGSGASSNTSTMGRVRTLYVCGTFTGSITVEGSNNGTTWSAIATVNSCDQTTLEVVAQFMRVTRANVNTTSPGTPIVGVCGTAPPAVEFVETVTNVFVDSVSGSDANNGLSAATALATLDEVYRRFPSRSISAGELIINLADNGAGGQAIYPAPTQILIGDHGGVEAHYRYAGPAMVAFTPASGPAIATLDAGTPADVVNNAGAVVAGRRTRLNFTTAAPAWTVDDFQRSFARITRGGSLVIPEIPISKNDADHIFVDNDNVAGAVLAGDTVEIVQAGARIEGPAPQLNFFSLYGPGSFAQFLGGGSSHFTRIEFQSLLVPNSSDLTFDRCALLGFATIFSGARVKMANCLGNSIAFDNCSSALGSLVPTGTFLTGSGEIILTAFDTIVVRGGPVRQSRPVSVWDATGDGIDMREHSVWSQLSVNATLMGSGNTGNGIRCRSNSICEVRGGSDTEITGAGGALRLSDGAAIGYGTGVGAFEEAAGFAGIFTRVQENAGSAASPRADASIIRTAIPA